MLHKSFKPAKCKTSLRLAIPRIKLLKNKKDVQIKQLRGELAKLLETGQDQTAKIRVEHVMREEKTKEAYELIEIYCELIVARMPIIESQKNCPLDLKEAVTSVIFASPRCADIPELMDVRKQFTAKYGKEFTSAAVELRPECGVSRMLVEKLSAKAPDGPTKIKILSAIAEEYNVKWESKVFEEKVALPPTDLLNGPNTFEKASRIRMGAIDVQVPIPQDNRGSHNVHIPDKPDINHDKPVDFNLQNPGSSSHSWMSSSTSINPGSYNPEVRRSEIDTARTEFRYSPSSGKKWNMEFKDAASAAQAAAESAERASMAARAAAELSILGKMSQHYSSPSQKSSVHKLRDEMQLPDEHSPKDSSSTTSHGGSRMNDDPSNRDAKISYSDTGSDTKKHINNNPSADDFEVTDKYPEMVPSEPEKNTPLGRSSLEKRYSKSELDYASEAPEVVESESSLYIGDERIGKESSRKKLHSPISLSSDDVILDNYKSGRDADENPFASYDHSQNIVGIETSLHANAVAFDESASDEDYDVESKHEMPESSFNWVSPDRKSEKNNLSLTNPWSPSQTISEERPLFSESSSSMGPSQKDDIFPVTFDHSDGPSSEDEEEKEKFKLDEDVHVGKYPPKQSVDFINPDLSQSRYLGLAGLSEEKSFGYGDSPRAMKSDLDIYPSMKKANPISSDVNQSISNRLPGTSEEKKLGYADSPRHMNSSLNVFNSTVDEERDQFTWKSSKKLLQNEVTDNIYISGSADTEKDTQISEESSPESINELNFEKLTGGFRNRKAYIRPSYVKNSSANALSFKQSSENSDSKMEKKPTLIASSKFDHNRESYNQRMRLQAGQKPSLRFPARSDQNDDDSEDEFADHHKSSQYVANEMIEKTTSKVAVYSDSDEDLSVQTITNQPRQNVGVSRRTKGSSLFTGGSSKAPSIPDYESDRKFPARRSSEPSSKTETQSNSSKSSSVAAMEVSKTTPEQRRSFKDEKEKPSTKEQPSISLPKIATEKSIESLNSSSGETPSSGKSSHVHPKLPDYNSFTAHFQSLRKSR